MRPGATSPWAPDVGRAFYVLRCEDPDERSPGQITRTHRQAAGFSERRSYVGRVAERLSDRLAQGGAKFAVAALAAVVPPALIADALKSAEELEERQRKEAGKKPRKRRKRKL